MSSRRLLLALAFVSLTRIARAEATPIGHGIFPSPDGRFAFVLTPARYGYHAAIRNLRTGTSSSSALVGSDHDPRDDSRQPEVSTPIDFETNIYRVNWTRDSKTFAVVYHVADGSAIDLFHFDGKAWHEMTPEPSPVDSKCPYVDSTEQSGDGPVIHYHGPSYTETIFDENARSNTVWISYGVETDESHRDSHFYVCNFEYNPASRTMSHIELRQIDIPTFLALRSRRDYSRSLYPTSTSTGLILTR